MGGPDPETLLLMLDLSYSAEECPYMAALDNRKAFDSVDWDVAIAVLEELKVPAAVTNLLADQWATHKRWITIGGAVATEPLKGVLGIPQGDCWSPIAISALLSAPARAQPSILTIERYLQKVGKRWSKAWEYGMGWNSSRGCPPILARRK